MLIVPPLLLVQTLISTAPPFSRFEHLIFFCWSGKMSTPFSGDSPRKPTNTQVWSPGFCVPVGLPAEIPSRPAERLPVGRRRPGKHRDLGAAAAPAAPDPGRVHRGGIRGAGRGGDGGEDFWGVDGFLGESPEKTIEASISQKFGRRETGYIYIFIFNIYICVYTCTLCYITVTYYFLFWYIRITCKYSIYTLWLFLTLQWKITIFNR